MIANAPTALRTAGESRRCSKGYIGDPICRTPVWVAGHNDLQHCTRPATTSLSSMFAIAGTANDQPKTAEDFPPFGSYEGNRYTVDLTRKSIDFADSGLSPPNVSPRSQRTTSVPSSAFPKHSSRRCKLLKSGPEIRLRSASSPFKPSWLGTPTNQKTYGNRPF